MLAALACKSHRFVDHVRIIRKKSEHGSVALSRLARTVIEQHDYFRWSDRDLVR